MKLSHLCSSLLNLSQNDELLNNTLNNYEEKLESSIEYIIEYLSIKDLFNLVLINKEFYKIIIKYFIEKIEILECCRRHPRQRNATIRCRTP